MNNHLLTINHKNKLTNLFVSDVQDYPHYLFVGGHTVNDAIQSMNASSKYVRNETFRNMMLGKKIANTDVHVMIRNIPYEVNKVYDMYDDQDENLIDKDFYCIVDEVSYYHVYKCLDNNGEANSTVEPDFSHISGANVEMYQTSDGYRWKYMYSVPEVTVNKFGSTTYFPVLANTSVIEESVKDCIDIVKVEYGGKGYSNYLTSSFLFNDIKINGNNQIHRISSSSAQTSNGFYTGCLLYVSSGTASGNCITITDYFTNSEGNYVILENELIGISNGDEYEISPQVVIVGDGYQEVNAVARGLVNTSSNSIYRVEMLDRGKGYQYAIARVTANDVVSVAKAAQVRPILGPDGGHGYRPCMELGAHTAAISIKISNSESNSIPTNNKFKQIGVLREPLFANVYFNVNSSSASFTADELIYKIEPIRFATGSMNTSSLNVAITDGDFGNNIKSGTLLYIRNADNTYFSVHTVNTVANDSTIILTTNGGFEDATVYVYLANSHSNAYVFDVYNQYNFYCSNVHPNFATGDLIVGSKSGSIATINTITRNEVSKTFDTFVQLKKYELSAIVGTFQENELVYQNSTSYANALFFGYGSNSQYIYTSNQVGVFELGTTIIGNTSTATANVANVYSGELMVGSGDIIYLENIDPIERANDQSETFNIYLEF